jgi:hypothetical protein
MKTIEITHHITSEQQGQYLLVPFEMPSSVERIEIEYSYPKNMDKPMTIGSGQFTAHERVNRIDLGLIAPDGSQVGASGSSRTRFSSPPRCHARLPTSSPHRRQLADHARCLCCLI